MFKHWKLKPGAFPTEFLNLNVTINGERVKRSRSNKGTNSKADKKIFWYTSCFVFLFVIFLPSLIFLVYLQFFFFFFFFFYFLFPRRLRALKSLKHPDYVVMTTAAAAAAAAVTVGARDDGLCTLL